MLDRAFPRGADLRNLRDVHSDAIDFRIGRQSPHDHRHVVSPTGRIDDVGKQKGLPIVFSDAAPELPSHQWMHFGIFVNGRIDPVEQSGLVKAIDVLM
jgi:hypothetical protein